MKNIRIFIKKLSVFGGEISIYVNRRVFVMDDNLEVSFRSSIKYNSTH